MSPKSASPQAPVQGIMLRHVQATTLFLAVQPQEQLLEKGRQKKQCTGRCRLARRENTRFIKMFFKGLLVFDSKNGSFLHEALFMHVWHQFFKKYLFQCHLLKTFCKNHFFWAKGTCSRNKLALCRWWSQKNLLQINTTIQLYQPVTSFTRREAIAIQQQAYRSTNRSWGGHKKRKEKSNPLLVTIGT